MCVCVGVGCVPRRTAPRRTAQTRLSQPACRLLARCRAGAAAAGVTRARAPTRACALAGCAWASSSSTAVRGAGSAREAVRGASPAGCPTCEGREADSTAREGNGGARSAAACALPLPQRLRLWLRRSRAVSSLQLHEGVVVGRKTLREGAAVRVRAAGLEALFSRRSAPACGGM